MKKYSEETSNEKTSRTGASISVRSFVTVLIVLVTAIIVCGALSYVIPQGAYERTEEGSIVVDSFKIGQVDGIALWRVITAPLRVFASEDALNIIMISVFLLVMSGVFNLLEKTGGIRIIIARLIGRIGNRAPAVICVTVLVFMLFGSFFGMFEELVTLLPIVILFMLSLGMDTMLGLGACMLAACFGFSAAITNPFSVGLASQISGQAISDGIWLRVVFFVLTYALLCGFLLLYYRRIKRNPQASLTYKLDGERRELMQDAQPLPSERSESFTFKVFLAFFGVQLVILVLIAAVDAIAALAIPLLAVSFLVTGTVAGLLVCKRKRDVAFTLLRGMCSMLPAVVMIALASSVKLVMTESGIMDTIMHYCIGLLEGKSPFLAIILIYLLILILQVFIGSASAKIILVMPIVMPIATTIGLSPSLVILAYCMADGFTDVILPTNPVLIVGLSMANVSYGKWVKWTWKLQAIVLALTALVLFFGIAIGY